MAHIRRRRGGLSNFCFPPRCLDENVQRVRHACLRRVAFHPVPPYSVADALSRIMCASIGRSTE